MASARSYSSNRYCGWPYGGASLGTRSAQHLAARDRDDDLGRDPRSRSSRVASTRRSIGAPGAQAASSARVGLVRQQHRHAHRVAEQARGTRIARAAAISGPVRGSSGCGVGMASSVIGWGRGGTSSTSAV
jgi:hypothetical protein